MNLSPRLRCRTAFAPALLALSLIACSIGDSGSSGSGFDSIDCSQQHCSEIAFAETSGAFGSGATFGASWGDRNGDGYPDLYISRHAVTYPLLVMNDGDGTFTSEPAGSLTDSHAGAWADFDNDGTQDYLYQVGADSGDGSRPNRFWVNYLSYFQEESVPRGLDNPLGRGRTPLWVDWDDDGLLDVILSNMRRSDGQSPTALFLQGADGTFSRAAGQPTPWYFGGDYASVIHLADETSFSVFVDVAFLEFWRTIYVPGGGIQPRDLQGPPFDTPQDHVFADLNGDLMTDVVVTRQVPERSELLQTSPSTLAAVMLMSGVNPDRQGASFLSPHALTLELRGIDRLKTHIGSSGDNLPYSADETYVLDPAQSVGIAEPAPGESGFYIGYEPATERWQFFTHSEVDWYQVTLEIDSAGLIQDIVNDDIVEARPVLDAMLILWDAASGAFVDASAGSGLDAGSACQSVVAEDFDNDTDLDLYMTCTGPIQNVGNVLFENLGSGAFAPVPLAGGAQGAFEGRADTVSSADFDLDGRVDLFVTNGLGAWPFHDGINQLFRNTTQNGNHWIEIDLVGVDSNRDGIGAHVTLTAGGVTQVRTRSGGMHRFAQNFSRLHFGLGDADTIDEITVTWPSGLETYATDVASDQVLQLTEPEVPPVPEPSKGLMLFAATCTMLMLARLRRKAS